MRTHCEALRSQWGGQGSTSFQALAMAWNEKQQKIVNALNEFEQNLITTEKDNVSTDDAQQSSMTALQNSLGALPNGR
ncbi:MAG: WXG100 family type VII secretion target [Tabrizicola sp.]|nr:WXG100 family type VII secretion target [Tabrizicola sp.]